MLRLAFIIVIIAIATLSTFGQISLKRDNYPAVWFARIKDFNKPDWEILPQEAKAGEVILSKRNELGILSTLAAGGQTFCGSEFVRQ
jgi:hypothetical protein